MTHINDEQKKEQVKEQFTRSAAEYVTSVTHAKSDDLDLLVEWLAPQAGDKALDVATGGGHVAKKLAPYVRTVFAVDLTPHMLHTARSFINPSCDNVEFVVTDAEALPFLDDTFDIVTCRIAAHHFPNPAQFVREAARVLKPGGKLLLIDNVVPAEDDIDRFVNTLELLRDESHVRCYRVNEWEEWLRGAGLTVKNSRMRKKPFDYPVWVRRTTRDEEQVKRVSEHILSADSDLQAYIGLQTREGEIERIHIDEWMVLAKLETD